MDILTRQTGTTEGAALHLEGGVPGAVEPAGAPEGTTITVRDLFYNTPARLKFMRGVEALLTPGDGKLDSAVYAALGRDFARGLVPVSGSGGDITVSGFVTAPLMGRGSRSMQVFFVNGRFIKSQLLTAALEEGYRNQIMKGKFPGCVLSVTLPVTAVDVNVPAAAPAQETRLPAASRQDFFQTMDAKTFRQGGAKPAPQPAAPARPAWNTELRAPARVADSGQTSFYQTKRSESAAQGALGRAPASVTSPPDTQQSSPPAPSCNKGALGRPPVSVTAPRAERTAPSAPWTSAPVSVPAEKTTSPESAPRPFVPAIPPERLKLTEDLPGQTTVLETKEAPWRIAGEVLRTYIICESEDGSVWLIDKHAAHERMNFDKLKNAQEPPMRQTLLAPIAAELSREDGALLLENLPLLEQFGFACEDFGAGALLVREVPADIDAADTVPTLEEFAERLRTGRSPDEKREALLHTMACKAAIKGGWVSDPAELRVLVDRVQSGEIKYCPHGRPVAVKLTKYELEKMFKRA